MVLGILVFSIVSLVPSGSIAANASSIVPPTLMLASSSSSNSPPYTSCAYNATASGNWNDPGTWNSTPVAPFPNTLPGKCTVIIPSRITVTIPDGLAVVILGTVQNGANLVVNEYASIAIRDNGTVNDDAHGIISTNVGSTIDNNGGEINNGAGSQLTIANSATFYNRDGSGLNNAGAIVVQDGAEFLVQGGYVRNSGSISIRGSIENFPSGTITNLAGGTVDDEHVVYNAGTIDNEGSIVNSGAIDNNGTILGSGVITGRLVTPAVVVRCSPSSVPVGSETSCTVRMLGTMDPTGGEVVAFASSSSTGVFNPSASCALSSGTCSVMYNDLHLSSPVIVASYPGDGTNAASSGNTTIEVSQPALVSTSSANSTFQGTAGPTTSPSGGYSLPLPYLIGAAAAVVIIISAIVAGRTRTRRPLPAA
jgi:hypothetical protein